MWGILYSEMTKKKITTIGIHQYKLAEYYPNIDRILSEYCPNIGRFQLSYVYPPTTLPIQPHILSLNVPCEKLSGTTAGRSALATSCSVLASRMSRKLRLRSLSSTTLTSTPSSSLLAVGVGMKSGSLGKQCACCHTAAVVLRVRSW